VNNPYDKIIKLLVEHDVEYWVIEHQHIHTSEEAAKVRGTSTSEGAKSLMLKSGDSFVMAIVRGDKKLDSRKLRSLLGVRKLKFASPEEVEQVMGCKIGSCYPFGNLIPLDTYADETLGENTWISYSPGVHNKSIRMKWADYKKIAKPEVVDIT